MMNSLFSGVSGLQANQQMLDTVGNNLANSNTPGFKAQTVRFSDLVYQTQRDATGSTSSNTGGTDPIQTGLGVQVAAIDTNLQQGDLTETGNALDMGLQGNGYFVVNDGTQNLYTRAGAFSMDSQNYLVDSATGDRVQRFGSIGEATATTPGFQTPGNNDVKIPFGTAIPGKATTTLTLQGNLDAASGPPLAQTLTSGQPFLAAGQPATATTTLDALDDTTTPYAAGDQLQIQGTTAAGTTVNTTLAVTATTTLQDLLDKINASFSGSTASLDAKGNLVLQAATSGPSSLSLSIADAAGDTGATTWASHALAVTTAGQAGATVTTGIQFYDSQGTAHTLSLLFQDQGNNTWNLTGSIAPNEGTVTQNQITGISFNQDGSLKQTGGQASMTVSINGLSQPQTINFSLGSPNGFDGLTEFGGSSTASATSQDGYGAGSLESVSVSSAGVISGVFTNGQSLSLGQLAIASFANPGALTRQGDNYYTPSSESGAALIGSGLSGGRGQVEQKVLESSNVDVSSELTQLIIAQRGFEVNAKTITTSDQVLQDLTNIIR